MIDRTTYQINDHYINIRNDVKHIKYNQITKKLHRWCKKYDKYSVLYIAGFDWVKIISADHSTQVQTIYLNYSGEISAARTFMTSDLPDIGVYNVEFMANW